MGTRTSSRSGTVGTARHVSELLPTPGPPDGYEQFDLAIVEVDDEGDFVHGWHNNAEWDNANLESFRRLPKALMVREFEAHQRRVIGVYVGWNGQPENGVGTWIGRIPGIKLVMFKDRYRVAEKTGQGDALSEILVELTSACKADTHGSASALLVSVTSSEDRATNWIWRAGHFFRKPSTDDQDPQLATQDFTKSGAMADCQAADHPDFNQPWHCLHKDARHGSPTPRFRLDLPSRTNALVNLGRGYLVSEEESAHAQAEAADQGQETHPQSEVVLRVLVVPELPHREHLGTDDHEKNEDQVESPQ